MEFVLTSTEIFKFEHAEDSPGFLLWQVANVWQKKIKAELSPFGLTHVQFVLLANMAWLGREGEEITQVQLAAHAKTDVMMTSQVLRTLEEKKLIQRTSHTTDSRAKSILLTEEGLALVKRTVPVVEQVDAAFFGVLENQLPGFNQNLVKLLGEGEQLS
jgi:MarR family transcriptional regulator, organic hydroperoxide resistance regulator